MVSNTFMFPRNAFLGFDHIFDELERVATHAKDSYPPHNVVKTSDTTYQVELAIAGFAEKDIDIETKDHVLYIKGNRDARRDQNEYVHKGIRGRKFEKSYRLSEYTEVSGANLRDGILTVDLEVVLPEEKRPRKIKINTKFNEETNDSNNTKKPELLNEAS